MKDRINVIASFDSYASYFECLSVAVNMSKDDYCSCTINTSGVASQVVTRALFKDVTFVIKLI